MERHRGMLRGSALAMAMAGMGCAQDPPRPEQRVEGVSVQSARPAAPAQASQPSRSAALRAEPAGADPRPAQAPRAPGEGWNSGLAGLPNDVLVGTDVVALSRFLNQVKALPDTGTFIGDQGGAATTIRLSASPQGAILSREFAEPGDEPHTKRYETLKRSSDGVRLSGKHVEVIGLTQSILVLEKRSGVDGIPDSLWIQYELPGR